MARQSLSATMRIGHVQLAMPKGREEDARRFFGDLLGMEEVAKPARLAGSGGCWFRTGVCEVHLGIDPDFRPQRKAHPCFLVPDVVALARRLRETGMEVQWDDRIPGVERFHTSDPFGNRLEFQGDSELAGQTAP